MSGASDRLASLKVGVAAIAVIAGAFALWALRHILTPFALAVFLLLVIDGSAKALTRRLRLPPRVALIAAIAIVVAFFGVTIWIVADNAGQIARESGGYTARIDVLLQMTGDRLGLKEAPSLSGLFHQIDPGRYAGVLAGGVGHVAEGAVFTLIYLGFMLASRRGFQAKSRELFGEGGERSEAIMVFRRVERGVESYIWVQTMIGLMIAAASAVLMWTVGLSHVLFWSFLIFLANYIPAIGAAVGVLIPPLFGIVELDALWKPIVLLVALEAVHFTVSHVVQPRMQGKSLNIDPIVVLLALAFWGVIWGLGGAFLSTPLTVIVMAICAEFPATRPLAVLLSEDGRPYSA
ncbi:MAG: AI-2E family transporter, partial [Caulobacteraceae bacterium]